MGSEQAISAKRMATKADTPLRAIFEMLTIVSEDSRACNNNAVEIKARLLGGLPGGLPEKAKEMDEDQTPAAGCLPGILQALSEIHERLQYCAKTQADTIYNLNPK